MGCGRRAGSGNGVAITSRPITPPRGGLFRTLRPAWAAGFGRLALLRLPRDGPEQDLDLDLLLVSILKHHDLIEPFPMNRFSALLEGLILALNDVPAHGALSLFVVLDTSLERHIEDQQRGRHLVPFCQVEQLFSVLRGQRRGIDHAEAVQRQPLFDQETHQGKGLRIIALVALLVGHPATRPIRRNNLGGAEVPLGKRGFPATRGTAEHDNRRPEETKWFLAGILVVWNIFGAHR